MYQLFSMAVLITMLSPQKPNLPGEFYQLPESVREQATLIVSGTYGRGRTPCILRSDGTRVWGLDSWITVKRVYRGRVGSRSLSIKARLSPAPYVSEELALKREYLVLLRPGAEKLKKIQTKEGITFWDAIQDDEIIAIVASK